VRYRQYNDVGLDQFGFKQSELDFQQYVPFFNETRRSTFRRWRSP
jgi:hypothetical protein